MARNIDFENLSDADVHYLRQRSSLVQEAELVGHTGIRKTVDEWEFDKQEELNEAPPVTPEGGEEEEETPPYSEWTNDELKTELTRRELSASGNKAELVARLEADDEESEEEEEEV